ncbi:unnamed protein product [Phaeothamnion confervicola]
MVHIHDQKAREIIVNLVREEGYSQKKAASIANVARSTVRKYVSTFEETGRYFREDENRTGRNDLGKRASDDVVREIEAIIQRSGTLYLDEIAEEVYRQTGKRFSVTTLWCIIKRANFTRQKVRGWRY